MATDGDELHPERVPGAEDAEADERKFTGYLLNPDHTGGGSGKAKFFLRMGFSKANWADLRDTFLEQLPYVKGQYARGNEPWGDNYEAVITIETDAGPVEVRTFWEVHAETGTKLLTAYPRKPN